MRYKINLIFYIFICLIVLHPSLSYCKQAQPIQKGITYVTWSKENFSSPHSDESLTKLSKLGIKYIAIIVTQYQDAHDSTTIKSTDNTPSNDSITHAIDKAHSLGLKVMLKPHIDVIGRSTDAYTRGDIGFSNEEDWKRWFNSYQDFILNYARLAEDLKAEILCIGTELSFTTQKDSSWRNIISKIRKAYSGKLVYAANWDDYKNVEFWDELDYVGIDAYFPLTSRPKAVLSELTRGWEKWKGEIRDFYALVKKPIIFTEIGYASTPHAAITPWKGGIQGNADVEIQTKCYQAFFDAIWGCSWLAGVYWWDWTTNVHGGGQHNRGFTPQNKPAQRIVEKYYKGSKS